MADVLITIDTELSPALHKRSVSPAANVETSVFGAVESGRFGIEWLMDTMEAHGLKGVFFVDPLPALVFGISFLPAIVTPILARGHEVQLHVHTEWLAWALESPVGDRRGQNIADFDLKDQQALLDCAAGLLEQSGAPRPIAFRAGNYGADDRTLSALAKLGIMWDSSFNPAYVDRGCRIGIPRGANVPIDRGGVTELPVASLFDWPGHLRPAQVCALSISEMTAALRHAAQVNHPAFVIVTHSFEMLSRNRSRSNRAMMSRFESMCREIMENPTLRTVGFVDLDPDLSNRTTRSVPV